MNKKQKENIKRIVNEGLNLITRRLGISNPSSKMKKALKKYSGKLIEDIKKEVKKSDKKKAKARKKITSRRPKSLKSVTKKTAG